MDLAQRNDELALALGKSITRWANLEVSLVRAFAGATNMQLGTSAALFKHVKTFSLMLDLVNTAVAIKLAGQPELTFWASLVEYIRELSGDRNLMAHTPVVIHTPDHPEATPEELQEVRLGPSIIQHLADPGSGRHIDTTELTELLSDFQEAIEMLNAFLAHLESMRPSQYKFSEPVSRRRLPRTKRLEASRKKQKRQT